MDLNVNGLNTWTPTNQHVLFLGPPEKKHIVPKVCMDARDVANLSQVRCDKHGAIGAKSEGGGM
jgi:hypothetical protein